MIFDVICVSGECAGKKSANNYYLLSGLLMVTGKGVNITAIHKLFSYINDPVTVI